jgi:hypothetical protein
VRLIRVVGVRMMSYSKSEGRWRLELLLKRAQYLYTPLSVYPTEISNSSYNLTSTTPAPDSGRKSLEDRLLVSKTSDLELAHLGRSATV